MMFILRWINKKLTFPIRTRWLTDLLAPYLNGSRSILDIGTSSGELALSLQKKTGAEFTGVDILVPRKTYIPVSTYEGGRLPFADNTFDCVLLIDVVHHDKNPILMIEEAKRVSKKHIVIKDHYWGNRADFLLLKIADYFGNKPYGINLPYSYLKTDAWISACDKAGLVIENMRLLHYPTRIFFKHIVLKVRK